MKSKVKQNDIFNWLVKNYYDRVLRTAIYYLRNRSDAEDITQDVFLKAFEKIDFSKTDESKFPILFIMAKNLSLNKIKSKGRQEETLPDWEILSNCYNPESDFDKKQNINEINLILKELKDQDREIILLKHYQDCSYQEISEILNIPIGTVMSRLYSARKKLQTMLKGVNYGE